MPDLQKPLRLTQCSVTLCVDQLIPVRLRQTPFHQGYDEGFECIGVGVGLPLMHCGAWFQGWYGGQGQE